MVTPYDPNSAVLFQHAPAPLQPLQAKGVVLLETLELIPLFVYSVHFSQVRSPKLILELEVIGGIGENQADRFGGHLRKHLDTIPLNDLIQPRVVHAHLRVGYFTSVLLVCPFLHVGQSP